MPMKQLYNFRLEKDLVKEVDKLSDNRTQYVTNALLAALQGQQDNVNTNYLQHLETEILYLRDLNKKMVDMATGTPKTLEMPSDAFKINPKPTKDNNRDAKKGFWSKLRK